MSHEVTDHVRDDVTTPSLDRAVVLGQAPDATKEYFRVPRVIDKGDEA
jgi:Asp-tRNA(Asn)/Glu-tRNA(Gln) amidotransferase C subunit